MSLEEMRVPALRIGLCIGFILGVVLSPMLWTSDRLYPLTPIFADLSLHYPYDFALFILLVIFPILIPFKSKSKILTSLFLVSCLFAAALDQTRWQPWFYQYILMFVVFLSLGEKGISEFSALNIWRFIVASIYFWSGAQKLNPSFVNLVFPWMLDPITRFIPESFKAAIHFFGYIVPWIEVFIGCGLIFGVTRQICLIAAILMHLFIISILGPAGHNWNSVVWPWNVTMILLGIILFHSAKNVHAGLILIPRRNIIHLCIILLFGVMPFFSLFGFWESYLSSALYSGNITTARIVFNEDPKLDPRIKSYIKVESDNTKYLSITDWSLGELNVPPYPQPRVYRNIFYKLCTNYQSPKEMTLEIYRWPFGIRQPPAKYVCN